MAYRYHSRRSARRLAKKSKRNFIITLIIVGVLIYSTFTWILPPFISGVSLIKNTVKPSEQTPAPASQNATLAPPVLTIPYEATNSSQINISGYGTPDTKVKLYLDDESKQTIDVSSDGSFTFDSIDLNLGTNNIYGVTLDENSKESLPSKTIKLYYINEKPSLSISEPDDNKIVQGGDEHSSSSNKKIRVSGKTDPDVKVFINGSQVIVNSDGNFSSDQPLNDGDNNFSIKALDIALNSTEIQRKVTYNP